eukprot:gene26975-biopygen17549
MDTPAASDSSPIRNRAMP